MRSGKTIFTQEEYGGNSTILHAAKVMLAGEEGSMPFRQRDQDWIVFFKPFLQTDVPGRSMEQISWSIGVVYSEDQIFDTYNTLLFYVVAISIIGLLVFYLLCRFVIRRQMRSLQRLTHAAQRVSEGHYDDPMPPLRREDEIGLLYQNFEAMKQSLDNHVKELTDLTRTLKRRREVTREIYAKEQSVDRMKSFFLYFVTNQMIAPAEDIERYVKTLSSNYHDLSPTEVSQIVGTIDMKSNTIIEMINDILNAADDETGKEVDHA
jgi:HAMP domain-containing protein